MHIRKNILYFISMMIPKQYYKISGIAQVYYKLKTGENLTPKEALNRWQMTRHPDRKTLHKAFDTIHKSTKELLNQT